MSKGKVRTIDLGLRRILRAYETLDGRGVTIGIDDEQGARTHPGGSATVAEVGAWLEFGTRNMLARPWLTLGVRRANVKGELFKAAREITRGANPDAALDAAGRRIASVVRDSLGEGVAPLAPATVAAKGSTRPLVDTGTLQRSITHKIAKGPRVKRLEREVRA